MSPATTKKCARCGEGFRGTMASEEVHCAKCFVKTCEVPEDTDEQFLKLVTEAHGAEMTVANPQASILLPMMKDILNHKARLKRLEKDVEENRYKSTKEKNRMKREIFRLREERKEMDVVMDTIKAKMLHLALIHPSSKPTPTVTTSNNPAETSILSPAPSSLNSSMKTPIQSPATPEQPKKANNKEVDVGPKSAAIAITVSGATSPPSSPTEKTQQQNDELPPPSPKRSPVKLAAAKFEEAAKKVNPMVTFAKLPSKKSPAPQPPKKEVNNNDTPVTASSSSEDEGDAARPTLLTRSNSVRDRIKAFEDIQRSASTGSYDRRKAAADKGIGKRSVKSMRSVINV